MLGRLLKEMKDNDALVEELYLRTLSREPTDEELETAIEVRPLGRQSVERV